MGGILSVRAPLGQGLDIAAELQVPSCSGTPHGQGRLIVDQAGLMDLAHMVTKAPFTCALLWHPLIMTHVGLNPSLARGTVLFAASGNEAHESITQGMLY